MDWDLRLPRAVPQGTLESNPMGGSPQNSGGSGEILNQAILNLAQALRIRYRHPRRARGGRNAQISTQGPPQRHHGWLRVDLQVFAWVAKVHGFVVAWPYSKVCKYPGPHRSSKGSAAIFKPALLNPPQALQNECNHPGDHVDETKMIRDAADSTCAMVGDIFAVGGSIGEALL